MRSYRIKMELVIHCPVTIIIEAESKESAQDKAWSSVPGNLYSAVHADATQKWRAKVILTPPEGVEVLRRETRAVAIEGCS